MPRRDVESLASERRLRKKLRFFHWAFAAALFVLIPAVRIVIWRDFSMTWFIPATLLLCAEGSISHFIAGLLHSDAHVSFWKTSNRFTACFGLFLLICSLGLSAICSLLSCIGPFNTFAAIRFPMVNIVGIQVDEEGLIYCADKFYSRFQVFDADGHFVRGWLVPNLKGRLIAITEKGNVQSSYISRGTVYTYSPEGRLLSKGVPPPGSKSPQKPQLVFQDRHGNEYHAISNSLSWRIEKTSAKGKEILISEPFNLWLIRIPLPGMALLLIFWLCGFLISRRMYWIKHHMAGYRTKK